MFFLLYVEGRDNRILALQGKQILGARKTKISIRLDNAVLEYFRNLVDRAGGGNYQTLINDALLEYVHRRSTLDIVRQAVREELAPYGISRRSKTARKPTRRARR